MPFLEIRTNVEVPPERADEFLRTVSPLVAGELGKPDSVMMTALQGGLSMTFGGTAEPLAMVGLSLLGFDPEKASAVVERLTESTASEFGIPPERIFVTFTDVPRGQWAGNGRLF